MEEKKIAQQETNINGYQVIDPRQQHIEKTTTPILNCVFKETNFKMPLYIALYNQIRFYEEYGKLKVGYSVASKESLAKQFGVSVNQIEKAFDHLTNRHKLGKWVTSDKKVYRNVTKVWVSNARLNDNSPAWGVELPELPSLGSITPQLGELAPERPPLSESNKKVSIKYNTKHKQNTTNEEYDQEDDDDSLVAKCMDASVGSIEIATYDDGNPTYHATRKHWNSFVSSLNKDKLADHSDGSKPKGILKCEEFPLGTRLSEKQIKSIKAVKKGATHVRNNFC